MSDLEQRLAEVLGRHADDAPAAHGLADAARGRARRRRRSRVAGAAAVAALAVGVPVAVAVQPDHPVDPVDVVTDREPAAGPGQLLRWESWHGVSVQVPADWGHGSLAGWCAAGGDPAPRVQRPGGAVPAIGCSPASAYGLSFQAIDDEDDFAWPVVHQDGDAWPVANAVGGRALGGVLVTVAAPTPAEAQAVLDSAVEFGSSDPNGCPPLVDDDPAAVSGTTMLVCRYDTSGLLEQSERLDEADSAAAAAALDATPQGQLDCQPSSGPQPTIDMFDGERDVRIALDGACTSVEGWPDGIADADVLYWALSPGFSGDVTGLPLPAHLRAG